MKRNDTVGSSIVRRVEVAIVGNIVIGLRYFDISNIVSQV